MTLTFSEPERQVLIATIELTDPVQTPNNNHYTFFPANLEQAAAYFHGLDEDWLAAYASLAERGFLQTNPSGWSLTPSGIEPARQERLDHPPIWYWYRQFFPAASRSTAYHLFCERLYGSDLCQAGFSDMAETDFLVRQSGLLPGMRALDLGCGAGGFAEYLSDQTGAFVVGLDYVPEAVEIATRRTRLKINRLNFVIGNLDHLDQVSGTFDLLTSIDTLYMPNNLPDALGKMRNLLAPGGKMLILYTEMVFDPAAPRDVLTADGSGLACALRQVGLPYRTWDFSEALFHLLRRKRALAVEMQPAFEAEDSRLIFDFLINESDGGDQPYDPTTRTSSRFLYEVQAPE